MSRAVDEIAEAFGATLRAAERADRSRARAQQAVMARRGTLEARMHDPKTRVVCLVGCGKSKASEARPVRELYTSPLFRKSVALAEIVGDATYAISAAKGLLDLDALVTPYDVELRGPIAERRAWAHDVVKDLVLRTCASTPRLLVVIFAGETYARPLIDVIEDARKRSTAWAAPVDLLAHLEIGERLAFLNRAIATLTTKGAT